MVAQRQVMRAAKGPAARPVTCAPSTSAALQLKWVDNGGDYLVWDKFVGTARWYFNKRTQKMFYRQAGQGSGNRSAEKTRDEWVKASGGTDPLAHEDASVVSPLDYSKAREQGNIENKGKKIVVSLTEDWSPEADAGLREIGNQWIAFGGDPLKEKEDEDLCSGNQWTTADEGADVSHDMFQPTFRARQSPMQPQWTYLARYEGEPQPIAVMILEVRKEESVQADHEHMYLRWLVAHPTKGGGAAELVKAAVQHSAQTVSAALRAESARSAIGWYQKQGLTLFKTEMCGCGAMGTPGNFKDASDDSGEEPSAE